MPSAMLPSSLPSSTLRNHRWRNWNRKQSIVPNYYHMPRNCAELRTILQYANEKKECVRVVGAGHSPANIAITPAHMVDLRHFNAILGVSGTSNLTNLQKDDVLSVHVEGGIYYEKLIPYLADRGLAIPTIGSIGDQSVGGTLGTGTHGSALNLGIMADYLLECEVMLANGEILNVKREQLNGLLKKMDHANNGLHSTVHTTESKSPSLEDDVTPPDHLTAQSLIFSALQCNLGCLGVIISCKLQVVPLYYLRNESAIISFDDLLHEIDVIEQFTASEQSSGDVQDAQQKSKYLGKVLASKERLLRFHWYPHTNRVVLTTMEKVPQTAPSQSYLPSHPSQILMKLLFQVLHTVSLLNIFRFTTVFKYLRQMFCSILGIIDNFITHHLYEFLLFVSIYFPPLLVLINRFYLFYLSFKPFEQIDRYDRILIMDCLFPQFVNEWSIPRENTKLAVLKLRELIEGSTWEPNMYASFPVEIRFAEADSILLSPSYQRHSTYINIIAYRPYDRDPNHTAFFRLFDSMMESLEGRPHWAKHSHIHQYNVKKLYPGFDAFRNIADKFDPNGRFRNNYINSLFS